MKIKKEITLPLPLHLSKEKKPLFVKKQKYHTYSLNKKVLKDVFVSHEGLVYKHGNLISNSAFNLKGKLDKTFHFGFWKLATEQYFVSTFGKSLRKLHLVEGEYLHVYSKWFGYFFWLTDTLPKLIKTIDVHPSVKLIFPESWNELSFVKESLKSFPLLKHELIPKGVHMQIKRLQLPETRTWSNAIDPEEIFLTRKYIFNYLDQNNIDTHLGEKIYISREKALRRKPTNENQYISILKKNGFQIVCMEDYNFFEQVSIMRGATQIIGIHGAGLTNAIFMKENGGIIELCPDISEPQQLRIPFWRIAHAVQSKFIIQFCKCAPQSEEIYDSNITVDVYELHKNIHLI